MASIQLVGSYSCIPHHYGMKNNRQHPRKTQHRSDPPPFESELSRAYAVHWRWHSLRMLSFMPKIFREFRIEEKPGSRLLDVACGEGSFAVGMAKRGWEVTGIDLSDSMLQRAAEREARTQTDPEHRSPVIWRRQDMRELTVDRPVHVATCWFNSLNYLLTLPELGGVFSRVREALVRGGWFFFDVYTALGLNVDWPNRAWVTVDEANLFIVADTRHYPGEHRATVHFTGFRRERENYIRFDEQHANRAYEWRELQGLLDASGFAQLRQFTLPDFKPPNEQAERLFVAAQAI